ncbi:DUF6025 family protein [Metabacillus iocasae]|uniref:Uncharacterized protein n=1 Tax=Priestia iocasae TaxID=2291674 RepID=A0ABS2QS65_9BACI|nr:DUF6025 family protein [Metabacillus iocasae]MBM7702284.1 hypothetical protein [Metabacillus iocasae]
MKVKNRNVSSYTHDEIEKMITTLGLIDQDKWNQFKERKLSFDWIHLGHTTVTIGGFLDQLMSIPKLKPPRTGHIGNWDEIINGRAGMMDFNKAICANDYGYPLLYCFNQTEDDALTSGDWVYLPGSTFSQGTRIPLPLFTWNGEEFVKRDRTEPLFTPFVQTMVDGEFLPLVQVHKNKLEAVSSFAFKLETSIVLKHEEVVKNILFVLLEEAKTERNARRAFQDLLSHQVYLDGRMVRTEITFDGVGYQMGDEYYQSTQELVDATLLPYHAVENGETFFANIATMPNAMPMASNLLSGVLSAILGSHVTEDSESPSVLNAHVHWGARDMAGYPPLRNGYFAEKSTRKSYKKIFDTLTSQMHEVKPMFLVLLPSVIFSLCPTNKHEKDAELLAMLFRDVNALDDHDSSLMTSIEGYVEKWLAQQKHHISSYFLNRFSPRSGILTKLESGFSSHPVEPVGFRELTFQKACMIVAALHKSQLKGEEA